MDVPNRIKAEMASTATFCVFGSLDAIRIDESGLSIIGGSCECNAVIL